jgi:DNA-binding helix-hairpin-helix protein with protein kinase domain
VAGNIIAGACRPFRPETLMPVAGPVVRLFPQALFDLASATFVGGHAAPGLRSTAASWHGALLHTEQTLLRCGRNAHHVFPAEVAQCLWCLGVSSGQGDAYPDPSDVLLQLPAGDSQAGPKVGAA